MICDNFKFKYSLRYCKSEALRTFRVRESRTNPKRIPKSSGSGVRSEGFFSVGIRSEVVQFGRSENPEFPNPENIDLLS